MASLTFMAYNTILSFGKEVGFLFYAGSTLTDVCLFCRLSTYSMEFEVVTSQNTVYHCKLLLSFISCMYSCATIIVPGSNLQIEPLSQVPLNLILESQQVPKHNPYSDHKERRRTLVPPHWHRKKEGGWQSHWLHQCKDVVVVSHLLKLRNKCEMPWCPIYRSYTWNPSNWVLYSIYFFSIHSFIFCCWIELNPPLHI